MLTWQNNYVIHHIYDRKAGRTVKADCQKSASTYKIITVSQYEQEQEHPLVSIIVRTKDRPELLKRALKSIAAQTYRPVEVVLVNDGGCDLEEKELKDILGNISLNYIRLEKNRGRAHAGNTGIKNAKGEYTGFLDDDDEFYENHLAVLAPLLVESGDKVAYSDAEIVYGKNMSDRETGSAHKVFSSYDFSYNDLLVENYIPLMCILFSSKALKESGGFDETFDLYEDWDLLLRIGKDHYFKHINTVTAKYYLWSSSEQIANVEGKEQVRKQAYGSIFYKHLKDFTPEVILNLKNKREDVENNYTELIQTYKKLEEDARNIIGRLNETEGKLNELGMKNYELGLEIRKLAVEKHELTVQNLDLTSKNNNLLFENKNLKEGIDDLRDEIRKMMDTLGWRMLTKIRKSRDLLIPHDTKRRALYNRVVSFIKSGKSIRKKLKAFPLIDTKKEYHKWIKANEPDAAALEKQRYIAKDFKCRPMISIIVPVYNPDIGMLESMFNSVLSQTYENWELCIADGNSGRNVRDVLARYSESDSRIRIEFLTENKHISGNSNHALSIATGEFVAFLDQDDELTPDALYEMALLLNSQPDADVIYSDEDKINQTGERCAPFFKPDWSPDLLLSVNYICHLSVIRTSVVRDIGGFRSGYEGAQDYDLILRVAGITDRVLHIPRVLYHWRMHGGSTSLDVGTKNYAHQAGERALQDYLKNQGVKASVTQGYGRTNYRVRYGIDGNPVVSIIIPFRDKVDLLKKCVLSILKKTEYKNYEIVLVSNLSREKETHEFIDSLLAGYPNIKFFEFDEEFNFSRINNFAAGKTAGDYLLFLNNDTEVISPDWLEGLLEHAQRKEIGVVGCKLLFPDRTIQHAGVILGMTGFAGHVFAGLPEHSYTYFGSADFVRNVLAVTGACMMIKRDLFDITGGFNESFVLCGSDVEICLKLYEMGCRNIYTPYAVLYHYESASRKGCPIPLNDFRVSLEVYGKFLDSGDPYYNPNLTRLGTDCSLSGVNEGDILKETVTNALG